MPQRCWYVLVLGVSSRDRKVPSCTGRLPGMGKRNCERPRLHRDQPSFSISVPLPGLPSKEPRLPVLIFCLRADFVLLSDSEPSGCESSQSTGDFNINTSVERVLATGHLKETITGLLPQKWTGFVCEQRRMVNPWTITRCCAFRGGSAAVPAELIQFCLNRHLLFCNL